MGHKDRSLPVAWRVGVALVLALLLLAALVVHLEDLPPLWWDEGWTLTVARTWVERGHYGRLSGGELAPPGLQAAFPVVVPVALSFRLFGVGVWQARAVIVLFSVAAMALIYHLARRLYNRPVAIATLLVLLLAPAYREAQPLIMARMVLAEMPMLFFALAGYACFLPALRRPILLLPPAIALWGIALFSKAQILPFWAVSLALPLLITLLARRWREAGLLSCAFGGSFAVSRLLIGLQKWLLQGHTLPRTPVEGLAEVTALVPKASVRLDALIALLVAGLPTLFGLGYAVWKGLKGLRPWGADGDREILRWALLGLAGSWTAWFLLLSSGWLRYLGPPLFLSSPFVAAMLYDCTDAFALRSALRRAGAALRRLRPDHQSLGVLLAVLLLAVNVPLTLVGFRRFMLGADNSVHHVAEFFNTQSAPDTLIETYDSELFFLLDRPYHHPPDQLHVELIRRSFLEEDIPIDYDPLAADPDYLVVGPYGHLWELYDPVLTTGQFRLLQSYGRYDIYVRVR